MHNQTKSASVAAPGPMSPEALQQHINRLPFNVFLGLRVLRCLDNGVELAIPWRDELMGIPEYPLFHGGVLAGLVDAGGSYAIAVLTGRSRPTIDLRIDYHKVAHQGGLLIHGQVIRLGSTISTAETRILATDGTLLASGRGAYFSGPPRYEHGIPKSRTST